MGGQNLQENIGKSTFLQGMIECELAMSDSHWYFRMTSQQMIQLELESDRFEVHFHLNGKLYHIW